MWETCACPPPSVVLDRRALAVDAAGRGSSRTSQVVDSNEEGAIFSEIVGSIRPLPLIKQTFVVICKGGRCAGDTRTAGEVIALAAGRAC